MPKAEKEERMTHDYLCDIAEKWLKGKSCGFVFKEFVTMAGEIPDAIGFKSGETILIECKATRADFLSDKKKRFRVNPQMGMGKFRFYMCPKGLISVNELPNGWGLIYVDDKGKARKVHGPKGNVWRNQPQFRHERCQHSETAMMYSALRRINLRGVLPMIYDSPFASKGD